MCAGPIEVVKGQHITIGNDRLKSLSLITRGYPEAPGGGVAVIVKVISTRLIQIGIGERVVVVSVSHVFGAIGRFRGAEAG